MVDIQSRTVGLCLCLVLGGCSSGPKPAASNLGPPRIPQRPAAMDINRLFDEAGAEAGSARACEAAEGQPEQLYSVMGRYRGAALQEVEACAGGEVAGKVITEPSAGPSGQGKAGVSQVLKNLPPEVAIWLAISDLFVHLEAEARETVDARGAGTLLNIQRSMLKSRDAISGDTSRGHVSRTLLEFRLSPGILCAAQLKIYKEEDDIVTPAVRAAREREGAEAESALQKRYGLVPAEKGQLLWQLVRQGDAEKRQYALMIHRSGDFDQPGSQGRILDEVLVCRSEGPMYARDIRGLQFSVRAQGHHWRAEVRLPGP